MEEKMSRQDIVKQPLHSAIERAAREKARIKNALLMYYGQMEESGEHNHIITNNEAQQILGVRSRSQLQSLLRGVYGVGDINDVLEATNLPFSTRSRR
ncbi:hypothetical protein A3A95_00125 [Candidatus Nomurabacteria bacterium RIFCSPLOWO2_01_FULL_39_18]|uniref:Uncharacterized protein n=1 Tax=Candidatus Nomurabacteria bacterium RIFCSPHIGHO2_01_FULL_40_20 TaxID=1801738 RepID=A0A1F6V246_9BACT|nr:MAG: hypothetical protein A2733_00765 [Candidatus Nomurabacteria bacterium RIFCSPHIGHO2_01_FULL_40_20]OGI89015.1 MAG: hypothetical protein A3A95_00125 [Candidatus Nomurabacteria bacterium RIFCSPLOWO2_01_FULL_39_18]